MPAAKVRRFGKTRPASRSRRVACMVVLSTVPDRKTAHLLAGRLLRERRAACVNVVPGLTSYYWWKGKRTASRELLLVIKTTRRLFSGLRRALRAYHPYQTPEVLALEVNAGDADYLSWLYKELKDRP